jgi:fermentation-respiration switch protein FrsA (DUF1100 family)
VLDGLVNWFLFCPSSTEEWLDPPGDLPVTDLWLEIPERVPIHAWWAQPTRWEPRHGAVLFCHGNGGNLSSRGEAVRPWLQEMGLAVLLFDYPGYGKSGGKPSEEGCYAAGEAAYHWLWKTTGCPRESLLLLGVSLGGGVAIELARRLPHRALVLINPFASLWAMSRLQFPWLPVHWLTRNRFDNLSKIPHCPGPTMIAHATADQVVPFAQGEQLFAAAREPRRFFPLEGFDHHHRPGLDFYQSLKEFLKRVERGP